MPRVRWQCPKMQARLAAMSDMGMSAAEIAKEIGATRSAVNWALDRYGLRAARPAPAWQCPKKQEALATLSGMGLSAAQIAEATGETRNAILGALDYYDLFARRRRSVETITLAERA